MGSGLDIRLDSPMADSMAATAALIVDSRGRSELR
jgi:hypothetical protein